MKKAILLLTTLSMLCITASAQDRLDNHKRQVVIGTQATPTCLWFNEADMPITVDSEGAGVPWSIGYHKDIEKVENDLWGHGITFGLAFQRSLHKATFYGRDLRLQFIGFTGDFGYSLNLHPFNPVDIMVGAGVAGIAKMEFLSTNSGSLRCSVENKAEDGGPVFGFMCGPYASLGTKIYINDDAFISLTARYTYRLIGSDPIEGFFFYSGANPFNYARFEVPFSSDLTVMLGIGLMIETDSDARYRPLD